MLKIESVHVTVTCPAGQNLVLVKVQTSQPGLHGWGCATFTQRYKAVVETIESYLAPLIVGRDARQISELHRLMHVNGYWRDGPVLNNAISGIDQALWDIQGKAAGMPVYQLLGGKVREAAAVYTHASGDNPGQLIEHVNQITDRGFSHVRVQISAKPHDAPGDLAPATAGYGGSGSRKAPPDHANPGDYFDPTAYRREMIEALTAVREQLPPDLEILHDVHSRLAPTEALAFAREVEPFRLFFLEDLLPPEQLGWYERVRQVCTTPQAVGELFVSRSQWLPLVTNRWIDFIRLHISAAGGLTPAWQAAQVCEAMGVRTAWHGPKDTSPVGHAVNVHLSVASYAFGVLDLAPFLEAEQEIFTGLPELRRGYLYPNDQPGLGLELDESAARRFPPDDRTIRWTQARPPDGSLRYP